MVGGGGGVKEKWLAASCVPVLVLDLQKIRFVHATNPGFVNLAIIISL